MFTTPARSEKMPPIAAKASGVAKRSVAASRPAGKTGSSESALGALEPERQPRRAIPRRPPTTSLRCPRDDRPDAGGKASRMPDGDRDADRLRRSTAAARARPREPEAIPTIADRACVSGAGARHVRRLGVERSGALLQRARGRRAGGAHVPDGDDQQLGAHEEDDRAPGSSSTGCRRARGEDVRVELAARGAHVQSGEEQRGEEDADGLVAPEQRDGDADEADGAAVEVVRRRSGTSSRAVDRAGEPGERARDGEREEVVAPDGDPAVAGRLGVEADARPRSRASSGSGPGGRRRGGERR